MSKPHQVGVEVDDAGNGRIVFTRRLEPPAALSLILGEFLYELRAALDNLCSELQDAECPPDEDPEIWRLLRWSEPHASGYWQVELACGHTVEACTDLNFDPSTGPKRVSSERQAQMTAEMQELWENDPPTSAREQRDREHYQRMLDQGWPMPFTERECWSCTSARQIIAYQNVGWLIPPPKRSSTLRGRTETRSGAAWRRQKPRHSGCGSGWRNSTDYQRCLDRRILAYP